MDCLKVCEDQEGERKLLVTRCAAVREERRGGDKTILGYYCCCYHTNAGLNVERYWYFATNVNVERLPSTPLHHHLMFKGFPVHLFTTA